VIVPYCIAREPRAFHALLRAERVTVLNQTPSALLPLIQVDLAAGERLDSVRVVIVGGEKLEPATLARWFESRAAVTPLVVNMYGITETTVHVTYRALARADATAARSVIGEALPDLSLRVLDAD
jgi:non-ribosomal peptide synthetase component F